MVKRDRNYWRKRFDQVEQAANNRSVKYIHSLEEKYRIAERELEAKINAWYQRIANNNEVTMTEARKLLNDSELKEFKWTVEEYIKAGEENELTQAWVKELENASAKFHINRLEALKIEARQQIEIATGGLVDDVDELVKNVYSDSFYRSCFEIQKGTGIGFDVSKLSDKKVSTILSKPWSVDGVNFSQKLWQNKAKLINTLDQELSRMVLTGDTPKKAIANISKAMGTSKFAVGRLVMTEQAYFTSLAQKDAFGELDVEEYEYVGTLDNLTCDKCGQLDGQHFPLNDMQPGVNAPPMHPFCRCTTCPYFDDEFTNGKRASRDSEGNTVYVFPEKMTYKKWKEAFVNGGGKSTSQEVLPVAKSQNTGYTKRTEEELKAIADNVKTNVADYALNASRWSGKIKTNNSLAAKGILGQKEWNCDISLIDTVDDGTVWHEMLHSCSASYYPENIYVKNQFIEEASVEFLTQQICAEKGIAHNLAYSDIVLILKSVNDSFKYGSDLEFAKELFNVPLPERYEWFENKVIESLKAADASFEDFNEVLLFIRQLQGGDVN